MIYILMGTSASGKDYIQSSLIKNYNFIPIISTTTRPIRKGEIEGREYYYKPKEEFINFINNNELIEYRTYDTKVNNIDDTWYYGITKESVSHLDIFKNYVVILDVKGCIDFIEYIGEENCKVFYIDCPSIIRTERVKLRGDYNEYEWNRRLDDDEKVFSKENMKYIDYKVINNYEKIEMNQIKNDKNTYAIVNRNINDVIKEIIGG